MKTLLGNLIRLYMALAGRGWGSCIEKRYRTINIGETQQPCVFLNLDFHS
jgi:hypothetical protein